MGRGSGSDVGPPRIGLSDPAPTGTRGTNPGLTPLQIFYHQITKGFFHRDRYLRARWRAPLGPTTVPPENPFHATESDRARFGLPPGATNPPAEGANNNRIILT